MWKKISREVGKTEKKNLIENVMKGIKLVANGGVGSLTTK